MKNITMALLCIGLSTAALGQEDFYAFSGKLPIEFLSAAKADIPKEKSSIIPFKLLGGLILIETEINGRPSSCIFDTGAPSVILNKDMKLMKDGYESATGITGTITTSSTTVEEFEMGRLKKKNIKAIETDISHIEKLKRHSIQGIIGIDVYKEEEILVDYETLEISILDQAGGSETGEDKKELIASLPFKMKDQLPVIKVKIGKKTLRFGVDTGAEVNVMDERFFKKLRKNRTGEIEYKRLAGINKSIHIAKATGIKKIRVNKQNFENQTFIFIEMDGFNKQNSIKLDGILGFPFLKENLISFDFKRSKINFWKKHP